MGLPYEDISNESNNTTTYSSGNPRLILDSLSASPYNSANEFSYHLTQGSLKFVNLHAKLSGSYPLDEFLVPNTWKTKFDLENSTTIVLKRPISITRLDDDRQFTPEKLENLEYEIEFEHTTVTPATSSTYLTSYADVTFGNLRTYSGDVHKVKLFGRQKDQQNAEFRKFGEFTLQPKNEIKDSTSVTGEDPIGVFYSQSIVDNFWQTSSAQPIQIDNSKIMNAVLISGSNYNDGDYVEFKTKNQFELEKDEEYIVSFKSYFIKKDKKQADESVIKNAEIEVFLSGSVVSQTGGVLSLGSISSVGDNASELLTGNVSGSIPNLYNYFTTHKKSGAKPKAGLVFRVNAGEFYISNVRLEPVSDRNFNPGFYKTFVPMPIAARRGQRYDFVAEFYDSNNNKADFEAATSASVLFAGAKQVLADGEDAVLTGSVQIGNSMEMYGVNPAYLRSIGYQGFDKTIAGTGDRNGGFMLWSGSVGSTIGASETYNGVGLEVVDASSTNKHEHAFLQFASNYKGAGNSRFRVQTDEFLLGISSSASNNYISGSNGRLEISSSNFELNGATGNVTLQGTITAAAGGTIGGFTIGSSDISIGNSSGDDNYISIDSSNRKFRIGQKASLTDSNSGVHIGTDGIALGASSVFKVTNAGALTATSGVVGGWTLGSTLSSTNILLDPATPKITLGSKATLTDANTGAYIGTDGIALGASSVFKVEDDGTLTATAGTIGGWTLSTPTLTGGTITLDSSGIIEAGGLTGISDTTNTGFYVDNSGQILIRQSGTDFLKFSGGSLEMKARTFDLDANSGDLKLDSVNKRISINDSTFGNAGVQLEHDTGTGKFYAGDGSSKFIQFDGSDVNIQSDDFLLSTSTLIIDSSTNNWKIALGSTPPTAYNSGTGFYIDGKGNFLFIYFLYVWVKLTSSKQTI